MKITCPFCNEPFVIEEEKLDRHLKCYRCRNKFTCSVVSTPNLGTMYLDILTVDDPYKQSSGISSIVWWCNERWYSWVKGQNKPEEFLVFWKHAPRIITFNGKVLDEPRICREFKVSPHVIHRDLYFDVQRKGLPTDLRQISELSGFPRLREVEAFDESTTVKLWKQYSEENVSEALQSLLCCSAWEIVHTYHLHCHLSNAKPVAMHETIPFSVDTGFLKPFVSEEMKKEIKTPEIPVTHKAIRDVKIKRPLRTPCLKISV
jgi:uncharacterized protein YprB with RNaseH-like and TPR domain